MQSKKKVTAMFVFFLVMGIALVVYQKYQSAIKQSHREIEKIKADAHDTNRFIAHAGGRIDGYNYTNSLEALNLSYSKGFKLFELDIMQTSDKVYVATHDWKKWSMQTGYVGKVPPSHQSFKKYKIYGKYTPLDINDINQWFLTYPDAILVTDKVNEPAEFSKKFMFKERLVMEIFSLEKMHEGLKQKIRTIMPNWDVITQLKGDKARQLLALGISSVAASRTVINNNFELVNELSHHKIRLYIYNVNKRKENNEIDVVCNDMNYIYGLYADQWDFNSETLNNIGCKSK